MGGAQTGRGPVAGSTPPPPVPSLLFGDAAAVIPVGGMNVDGGGPGT